MTLSEICGGLGENFHMEHADGLITMIPCLCKNRLTTEWLACMVTWFTWALEANCIRQTVSLLF